jgi:perosamine synthetase
MIPLTRPLLGDEEMAEVAAVLQSGMLVQGARVQAFEQAVALAMGRRSGVAVTSGTSALALALDALDVGPGDEVICPDLTWPSPVHVILERGAVPVLVDVDAAEWNARPEALAAALSERTAAAILIDQLGNPSRSAEAEAALGDTPLIVDAACSLGSARGDEPCGKRGVIACTSFHPRKVITTGEGGMCVTDDEVLAERIRVARNHGQHAPGRFTRAAGNHRMSDLAAALGVVQMARLPEIVAGRRRFAAIYAQELPALGLSLQVAPEGAQPNHQTLGVLLPEGRDAAARDALIAGLAERGVQAGLLSFALHRLPHLSRWARPAPASASVCDRGMSLPLYPQMSEDEVGKVIDALRDLVP